MMKKRSGIILLALIVVYLLINMASVITYPNEYKVIKTMGKISRVTTEPGFSLRIPLIQSETTISKARKLTHTSSGASQIRSSSRRR